MSECISANWLLHPKQICIKLLLQNCILKGGLEGEHSNKTGLTHPAILKCVQNREIKLHYSMGMKPNFYFFEFGQDHIHYHIFLANVWHTELPLWCLFLRGLSFFTRKDGKSLL